MSAYLMLVEDGGTVVHRQGFAIAGGTTGVNDERFVVPDEVDESGSVDVPGIVAGDGDPVGVNGEIDSTGEPEAVR